MHQDRSAAMGLARRPYIKATEPSMKVSQWRGASFVELRRLLPQSNPLRHGITCRSADGPKLRLVPICSRRLGIGVGRPHPFRSFQHEFDDVFR